MKQFLRFCVVGSVGFGVDAGLLQALIVLEHANPYLARVASFLTAASVTWLLNRRYTFGVQQQPNRSEWSSYIVLMLGGAIVNYSLYSLYIALWDVTIERPWLGVALGSIGAIGLNFSTSRRLFRNKT